jgi:hypothetical protein
MYSARASFLLPKENYVKHYSANQSGFVLDDPTHQNEVVIRSCVVDDSEDLLVHEPELQLISLSLQLLDELRYKVHDPQRPTLPHSR